MVKELLELPDIRRKDKTLGLRCGQCIFLNRHAVYEKSCTHLGSVPSSVVCTNFSPDPRQIGDAKSVGSILRMIANLSVKPKMLVAAMVTASKISKLGFSLGQKVYFRVSGADYLSNYAAGYVVGATRDVIVLSGSHGFTATVVPSSVMTAEKFEAKRSRLLRSGKIKDPNGYRHVSLPSGSKLMTYIPEVASRKEAVPKPKRSGKGPIVLSSGV